MKKNLQKNINLISSIEIPLFLKITILLGAYFSYVFIDYKATIDIFEQEMNYQLKTYRNKVITEFKQDFDRVSNLREKRGSLRLNLLNDATIIPNNQSYNSDNNFITISLLKEKIIISQVVLLAKIRKYIPENIGITIETEKSDRPEFGYSSDEIIRGSLYLNSWIENSYIKKIYGASLINSYIKSFVMTMIGVLFIISYLTYSRRKVNFNYIDKLRSIDIKLKNNEKLINRLQGENNLLSKFSIEQEFKVNSNFIVSLVSDIECYFFEKIKLLKVDVFLDNEMHLPINKGDFSKILFSLIYHKVSLSKDLLEISITFNSKEDNFIFLIEDNGFRLQFNQLLEYSARINKPAIVIEWENILAILESHNSNVENSYGNKLNKTKILFPVSNKPKENVCYLKDYFQQ